MRRARSLATLALGFLTLGLPGLSDARAGVSVAVQGSAGFHHGNVAFGFGFGSPYYWDPFWYPGFGWAGYYYAPPPAYGYAQVPPRSAAPVEMHVSPKKATVVVDGSAVGQARDFDTRAYPLWLRAGPHVMELHHKGYKTLRVRFDVKKGRAYKVRYQLHQGDGTDPRSAATAHEPRGEAED